MDRFDEKCLINDKKPQRQARCIAVGGMISSGKTTLVDSLVKRDNFIPIYELDGDKNSLMYILLTRMYQREQIAQSVCQLQFLLSRFENYKTSLLSNDNKDVLIFDRTIFEDRLFAFHNMFDEPNVYEYYEKLWRDKVAELIYNIGTPALYIILEIDWDTFKQRLFTRGREIEIDNFKRNEQYFMMLNKTYIKYLKNICHSYCIPYILIDATLPLETKIEIVENKLREIKIL